MSKIDLTKVAQPSNPAANHAQLYYDTTLGKPAMVDESGNLLSLGGFATKDYRLIKVTHVFQGTTTYTPTAGAKALFVECVGGGGSGGGAASSTGGTNNSVGGGGGAGGYSAVWLTGAAVKASYTVQVGAGGTAATAGNNAGNAGTDTTFDSPSVCTAKAGAAGGGGGASATALGTRGTGGAGGLASGGVGDLKTDGGGGAAGVVFSVVAATGMVSGQGGASMFGMGGPSLVASGASAAGPVYGSGSAGSCDAATTNRASGAGANGLIRVWEFA
jgi:hypothetical protein